MAKKTVKPSTKKVSKKVEKKVATSEMIMATPELVTPVASPKKPMMSSRTLTLALVVLGIALLTYKAGPYFVPAMIGYTPVTRLAVWQRMEKSYGTQTLDDLVNEKILDAAIMKSGIKVDQAKVDEQLKNLETQFESTGGLDAALEQRGLTKQDLVKQITTQLSVEEVLKDKIQPTDEEVKKAFDDGSKTTYKDKKFDDVKASIVDELTQSKLREEFLTWFETVKADAKVKSFGL